MSFPNETKGVVVDDIEAHVPLAVAVLDKHASWKSDTLSVSAASHVSENMLHFGVGKTMAKKAKQRIESGKWPGNFAVCFMFTFGVLALGVLLPIFGVVSALVGQAFVEQQVLGTSFPGEVFDIGYVVGQFIIMGLAHCGAFISCIALAFIGWKMIKSDKVPRVFHVVLVPMCMLSVAGVLTLPALVIAKIISDTFGLRLEGVFIFLLVANVMQLFNDAALKCLCGGAAKKRCRERKNSSSSSSSSDSDSDSDSDDDDENDDDEWFEDLLSAAWRALSSYVAYIAATNGGYLPTIVNGKGLAAVLGAVGGTFLVPVFMAFQLQAQAILGQDTGNSTVPFFT